MDKRKELGETLDNLKGWGGLTVDLFVARFVTLDAAKGAFRTLSKRANEVVRTERGVAIVYGTLTHCGSSFNVAGIICPVWDTDTHVRWFGDTTVEGLQDTGMLKLGDQNRDQFSSASSPLIVHEFVVVQRGALFHASGPPRSGIDAAPLVGAKSETPPAARGPHICGKCGHSLHTEALTYDASVEELAASALYCARCDDLVCVKCGVSRMLEAGAVPCGKCGAPALTPSEGAHPSWYPGERPAFRSHSRNTSVATPTLDEFSRDLTESCCAQEATSRAADLTRLVHELCRQRRRPIVLVGEETVTRTLIIDVLAARLHDGDVPTILQGMTLLSIDVVVLAGKSDSRKHILERVRMAAMEAHQRGDVLLLFEHSSAFLCWAPLRRLLLGCEGTRTATAVIVLAEHNPTREQRKAGWFEGDEVVVLDVPTASADEAVDILTATKSELETFHALVYADEAIAAAVRCAGRAALDGQLVDRANALLDQAGAAVKCRLMYSRAPEILAAQANIGKMVKEMEGAIATHDFNRARAMSDEERAQRELLRQLEAKSGESAVGVVAAQDVEAAYAAGKGLNYHV